MSQNIADFYTSVQANDFARQFQFRVVQLANITFNDTSLVYIETANLPGRAINNIAVQIDLEPWEKSLFLAKICLHHKVHPNSIPWDMIKDLNTNRELIKLFKE